MTRTQFFRTEHRKFTLTSQEKNHSTPWCLLTGLRYSRRCVSMQTKPNSVIPNHPRTGDLQQGFRNSNPMKECE